MLRITEKILKEVSESFANKVAEIQQPVLELQKTFDQISEPLKQLQEEMNKRQEVFDQMGDMLSTLDLPKFISDDVIKFWEKRDYLDPFNKSESKKLAEDFGYNVTEAVEEMMDENCPDDHLPKQLRLTSNGRLFVVSDPNKEQELTKHMERLLRDLKKTFTPTQRLIKQNGYTTIRSLQTAVYKLNGWGYGTFGLNVPIVIGRQGRGYRLSEHVYIHKLPSQLDK